MLGKSDMNLFVKSKEECYFVNGLEVVSFHDIFTEIGVIYLLLLLLLLLTLLSILNNITHTFSPTRILKTPKQHYSNSSTKHPPNLLKAH